MAARAMSRLEVRLGKEGWAEYYDGKSGRYVGKQARKFQTWSIAGYLVSKMMLDDPSYLGMVALHDVHPNEKSSFMTRSASWTF